MTATRSVTGSADEGFSLLELIMAVVLLGIVGSLAVTVLVNTWWTQESVSAQTRATARGQLIASEIERAMRNAVAFEIADGGATLKVTTSLDGDMQCQAMTFTGDGARMTVTDSPNPDSAAWPLWQPLITRSGAADYFVPIGSNGVTYTFDATTAEPGERTTAPVHFTGDAYMRNASEGTMSPCW
ncbi:type II secretion system protein J [Microbacterium sp. NPDC058062]|uniref:PulJ/GspJ family protein n=1 Tax=Microbacterium sp. NPDC058062 TaxID=3346320 RepID=UPI0036DF3828